MNMEDYFDMLQKAAARNAREKANLGRDTKLEETEETVDTQDKRYS